ncbi:hypothetical protein [Ignatzschineria sp. LJL83]
MIILLGRTGMIGNALYQSLIAQGKEIWAPSRAWLSEFDKDVSGRYELELRAYLTADTMIINTLGLSPAIGDRKQKALYERLLKFFKIAVSARIGRILSLSALSHYADYAKIPYLKYKYQLDQWLLTMHEASYIIKPSLVYAENGASTRFFQRLSQMPVIMLPKMPETLCSIGNARSFENQNLNQEQYSVSPIQLEDLIVFIEKLMFGDFNAGTYEVGSEDITIENYLRQFNSKLKVQTISERAFQIAMNAFGIIQPKIAGNHAYQLLKAGSTPKDNRFAEVVGRKALLPVINNESQKHDEKCEQVSERLLKEKGVQNEHCEQ